MQYAVQTRCLCVNEDFLSSETKPIRSLKTSYLPDPIFREIRQKTEHKPKNIFLCSEFSFGKLNYGFGKSNQFLCGRTLQKIARSRNFLGNPMPVVRVPVQMLRLRPDVRMAERELKAARFGVRSAQATFLPSLTLDAYAGFHSFRRDVLFNPVSLAFGLLAGLVAPIFQNNTLKVNYKISVARNYEAYFEYQKTLLRAFQEIQTFQKILVNL